MKSNSTAIELRAALAAAERTGAGRPYPEALRRAAVAYLHRRRQQGACLDEVQAELGVSGMSLSRWSRRCSQGITPFRPIEVLEAQPEPPMPVRAIVVHGPRGVRIEGLTVPEVAELLERLS
jgi:transposase